MNDPEIVRRRLLAILAKRRPDLDERDREHLIDLVIEHLDPSGDLTHFWNGIYGVTPVA